MKDKLCIGKCIRKTLEEKHKWHYSRTSIGIQLQGTRGKTFECAKKIIDCQYLPDLTTGVLGGSNSTQAKKLNAEKKQMKRGEKLLWNHMDLLDVFLVIFYPTDVFLWINLLRQFLTKSTLASKVKKARRKIFKFYGHLFMTTSQVSSNSFVSFSKLQTWTL